MGTDYRKIEFAAGESIETVVAELLKHNRQGELVCGCFNGHMLYSDKVTLDNVYLAVLGKSKAEYDMEKTEWIMREERKKEEYEAHLPELEEYWQERGHQVMEEKYWAEWDSCVPIQLRGLYEGILENCLELIEPLNNGCSIQDAGSLLEMQGHSGGSKAVVVELVRKLCHRGREFAEEVS